MRSMKAWPAPVRITYAIISVLSDLMKQIHEFLVGVPVENERLPFVCNTTSSTPSGERVSLACGKMFLHVSSLAMAAVLQLLSDRSAIPIAPGHHLSRLRRSLLDG